MANTKVIFTDLDGTLFYPKKKITLIPRKNVKFLNRFLDDGGRVVLVSGRNKYFGDKVSKKLHHPVDMIGCNGAFVKSDGKIIKETLFKPRELEQVFHDMQREYKFPLIMLFAKDHNVLFPRSMVSIHNSLMYNFYEFLQGAYREPIVKSDKYFYEAISSGEVYKLFVLFGIAGPAKKMAEKACHLLRLRYPNLNISYSGQAIEITPEGCSKDSGIAFYLEHNKIPRDNVLVVGDSGNDISMFDAYKDGSFCMSHAPENVKSHAHHIIKRISDLESFVYPWAETKRQG